MANPQHQDSFPPSRTGLDSGASDEGLAAALRASDAPHDSRPVAALLARHWQPVLDYAAIGAPSAKAASLLTAAAFARVLENLRRARTTSAIRPLLLTTARHIAKAWASDTRVTALAELQNPRTGRTAHADMFTLPANRALVARAFLELPGSAQCLLWHSEVEAEDISVPAVLLAMDPRGAALQLEQAREMLRSGILRCHLEIAPQCECRYYNRLLDLSARRGGEPPPGVRAHLAVCRHCRFAADQLDHREGRLSPLLAEGVLGWAAQSYLDSRPARRTARHQPRAATRRPRRARPRTPPSLVPLALRGRTLSRRGRTALFTGVGAATGLLIAATVVTGLRGDHQGHREDTAASAGASAAPLPEGGAEASSVPAARPSATAAVRPFAPLTTQFRHAESGLCLDLRGRRAEPDTDATTAACAHRATQRWVYEEDGRLRSAVEPGLCLNSRESAGVLSLTDCPPADGGTADATGVRYDLTVQGQMVPRWHGGLAVAPGSARAGADVVVELRDDSAGQRWLTGRAPAATEPGSTPKATPGGGSAGPSRPAAAEPPTPPGLPGGRTPADGMPRSARSDRVWGISDRQDPPPEQPAPALVRGE
ncbi:RICIN domain-containing protein [Streptomyces amakusaensis]|uniref:RICIN domain-containing protein n=1 Tax=Streptomyces amakusaensis TaxID=67271 RepID=A0ABW0ALT3_9ACTN